MKLVRSVTVCGSHLTVRVRMVANKDQGCRKGKRECTYPGSSSASKSTQVKSKDLSADGGSSPSEDELDDEDKEAFEIITDEPEDVGLDESEPTAATTESRGFLEASTSTKAKMESPLTDSSTTFQRLTRPQPFRAGSKHAAKPSISHCARWSTLPKDVKMYLKYHRDHMSHHHYAFKYDGGDFLRTTFLEIAMNDQSQAMLYAIVAFAAYHYALAREDSRISTFLSYYNRSIILLQQSLKNKRPGITTLLTILQLATIEVGHHTYNADFTKSLTPVIRSFSGTGSICSVTKEQHIRF